MAADVSMATMDKPLRKIKYGAEIEIPVPRIEVPRALQFVRKPMQFKLVALQFEDFREGVTAFLEKRPATFKGK
jgi:hypothetical protein